jgi:hypothetical protein
LRAAAELGLGPVDPESTLKEIEILNPCLAAALALDANLAWKFDLDLIRRSAAALVEKVERYVASGDPRLRKA